MIAEFIEPSDPRWMNALACARYDFYHLPEYIEFAAKHEGGTPHAFYAEEGNARFLAPCLVREIPAELDAGAGWCDVTTPYGYPSPLLTSPESPSLLLRFLEEFRRSCMERGFVSAFFRLHPLLQLPVKELKQFGTLVHHGQTVYIDLSLSAEDIWRQTRRSHRKDIRRLRNAGFKVITDDWNLYGEFISMYRETMIRRAANEFYMFSDSYFEELHEVLGDRMHLHTVVSPEGEAVSAGLCVTVNGIVQDHLGATFSKHLHLASSKYGSDYLWRWAKEAGNTVLHMGGGVGGGVDTLFEFKSGFSTSRADFYTYRMVLDKSKNSILLRRWRELGGFANANDKFFPKYRRPYGFDHQELTGSE